MHWGEDESGASRRAEAELVLGPLGREQELPVAAQEQSSHGRVGRPALLRNAGSQPVAEARGGTSGPSSSTCCRSRRSSDRSTRPCPGRSADGGVTAPQAHVPTGHPALLLSRLHEEDSFSLSRHFPRHYVRPVGSCPFGQLTPGGSQADRASRIQHSAGREAKPFNHTGWN